MSYKTYNIDLTLIVERAPVVSLGRRIGAVSFPATPAGASFSLHLGNQDPIPVTDSTVSITGILQEEDAEKGVFYSNAAAQPGVVVPLVISSTVLNGGAL